MSGVFATFAYLPLLEPFPGIERIWFLLLLPLAFGISMTYKAVRVGSFDGYWRSVGVMTAQIVVAMTGLALALVVVVQLVVPLLPAE